MDFTLKILKAEKENQVFSPINIAHAFGLLLHGASGDTEKEISNILGYSKFTVLYIIGAHQKPIFWANVIAYRFKWTFDEQPIVGYTLVSH